MTFYRAHAARTALTSGIKPVDAADAVGGRKAGTGPRRSGRALVGVHNTGEHPRLTFGDPGNWCNGGGDEARPVHPNKRTPCGPAE
jgi:hypothetical protein